jgi:hypothetical protein
MEYVVTGLCWSESVCGEGRATKIYKTNWCSSGFKNTPYAGGSPIVFEMVSFFALHHRFATSRFSEKQRQVPQAWHGYRVGIAVDTDMQSVIKIENVMLKSMGLINPFAEVAG